MDPRVEEFLAYLLNEYPPFGTLTRENLQLAQLNFNVGPSRYYILDNDEARRAALVFFMEVYEELTRRLRLFNPDFFSTYVGADFDALDRNSLEYKKLTNFMRVTQNMGGNPEFTVQDIFKVRRLESNSKCLYNNLNNDRYLLHGTYPNLVVEILKKGLRHRPVHVRASGTEYVAEGIHFADMAQCALGKGYRYDKNQQEFVKNPIDTIIVFVCRVKLGKSKTLSGNDDFFNPKPYDDYDSVVYDGRTFNPPMLTFDEENYSYQPPTLPRHWGSAWHLYVRYNEYVVKDPNQISIDYVVKMTCNPTLN